MLLPTRAWASITMKYLLSILLFLSLTAIGQPYKNFAIGINGGGGGHHITGINFVGKTAVFIGNSITFGVAASDNAHRWSSLFCAGRSATEDNLAISGMTVQNVSAGCGNVFFDKTIIPSYNSSIHSALILALGVNDIGETAHFTSSAFYTQYSDDIVYAISTKGWPPNKIIILNSYKPFSWNNYVGACSPPNTVPADNTRIADYQSKILQVATENGCWYIDIYSAMNGLNATYFAVDGLHPNNSGHAFIANYLISYL